MYHLFKQLYSLNFVHTMFQTNLNLHRCYSLNVNALVFIKQSHCVFCEVRINYTVCPTRYRTRHFFNNSNINEDIATKFEQEYVRCVRNEEECVCSPLQVSLLYPH